MSARAPLGGLLRTHRDFRLLWLGEVTGKYGDNVATVALPLVALGLHASGFEIGALTAAVWLPWLVVGLPVGVLVDRMRRRPVMVAASAVSFALFASVPVAAWCGLLTYGMLLAVALLTGCCAVFFQTAYGAYLPSLLAPADRPEGNAKLNGSASAAQIAGLGSAGLLAAAFGAVAGLLANAATFLVSAVCLVALRHREAAPQAATGPSGMGRQIREGLAITFGDPWIRAGTLYGALVNFALTSYDAILVAFLVRTVGLSSGEVGVLMAFAGVGGVTGAFTAGTVGRRVGTARAIVVAGICVDGLALLLPLTTRGAGMALCAAGGFAVAAGVVMVNVLWGTFRQQYCPPAMYGRLSASSSVLNYGLMPVGAVVAGALASAYGLRDAMWITTAAVPLTGLLLLFSPMARHRDLPRHVLGEQPGAGPAAGEATADEGVIPTAA